MARTRSPVYPGIGLREAIERVRRVYENDYTSPVPKKIIAEHMGYSGLSGKALAVLSALNKYGLLEGRGDDSRVTPLAVEILAHESGTPERTAAIVRAAMMPDLFVAMDERSQGGKGSDAGLKAWLQTQGFIPSAAEAAIRSYRETKELVATESAGYIPERSDTEQERMPRGQELIKSKNADIQRHSSRLLPVDPEEAPAGMRRAVFTLVEGDVEILFPKDLSPESVTDLNDYLDIWLRKMKRDARLPQAERDRED